MHQNSTRLQMTSDQIINVVVLLAVLISVVVIFAVKASDMPPKVIPAIEPVKPTVVKHAPVSRPAQPTVYHQDDSSLVGTVVTAAVVSYAVSELFDDDWF